MPHTPVRKSGPTTSLDHSQSALSLLGEVLGVVPAPRPGQMRMLGLVLTSACNLKCWYCYQDRTRVARMDSEVLQTSVDRLLGSGYAAPLLCFYGGEPLLELALIRRTVADVEERRAPGTRARFAISTNGTLLDPETARFLAEHRVQTQLSFDGVPAAQEQRGAGTFPTLDRLLIALRRDQPRFLREDLSVKIRVNSRNLTRLAASIRYFLRRGVQEISFAPLVTHDEGWRPEMVDVLDRQLGSVFHSTMRHYQRTGDVPVTAWRHRRRGQVDPSQDLPMCGVRSGDTAIVDVDGDAFACAAVVGSPPPPSRSLLREAWDQLHLGDVRGPRFGERLASFSESVRASALFNHKELKRSSYGRCKDCRFLPTCHVCPVSIAHLPGNPDPRRVPDSQCAFNLVTLKYQGLFPTGHGSP